MPWIAPLLTVFAGLFGGYLGAYMAKKGENKAIHEDIEKLVDQVKAVTTTTEEIKASMSTVAWKRDLKKEACYDLLRQLQPVALVLSQLLAAYKRHDQESIQQAQIEFAVAYGHYINAQIVLEMVASEYLRQALRVLTDTIMQAQIYIKAKEISEAWVTMAQFASANEAFMNACRRELGFEEVNG
jgi:hypothetical protein